MLFEIDLADLEKVNFEKEIYITTVLKQKEKHYMRIKALMYKLMNNNYECFEENKESVLASFRKYAKYLRAIQVLKLERHFKKIVNYIILIYNTRFRVEHLFKMQRINKDYYEIV